MSCILSLPVCSACYNRPLVHVITCSSISSLDFFSTNVGFASCPYRSTSPSLLPNLTVILLSSRHNSIIFCWATASIFDVCMPGLSQFVCRDICSSLNDVWTDKWIRALHGNSICLDCVLAGDNWPIHFNLPMNRIKLEWKSCRSVAQNC